MPIKSFLSFLLLQFGIRLIREHEFVKYAQARDLSSLLQTNINWFEKFSGGKLNIDVLLNTKSQMGQEIFAHIVNGFAPGFFVEVGVGDGISISNTALLEKLGWKGILVEANPDFIESLYMNRKSIIEPRALYSESNIDLEFYCNGYLSKFTFLDDLTDGVTEYGIAGKNRSDNLISVKTITFTDLFEKHAAPQLIDFISIDVEGAELYILQNFPFDSYKVKCWSIEHNFSPLRDKIEDLLRNHGYRKIFEDETLHDDFYVEFNNTTPYQWLKLNEF